MSTGQRSAGPRRDNPQSLSLPMVGVAVAILLIVIGAVLASRRDEKLPTVYGRRRGSESSRSVNGTAVLADLYRHAGHRVATMGRFSPKAKDFQTIVWAPNDFQPPDKEHREFIEDWLSDDTSAAPRTLVYIGRDYDAAVDYWNRIVKEAPPNLADEALHRQAEARANWEAERSMMPEFQYDRWFTARRDEKPKQIDKLSGPWAAGIDAKEADLHLEGRLSIPTKEDFEQATKDYEAAKKKTSGNSAAATTTTTPKTKTSPARPTAKPKPGARVKAGIPVPLTASEPEKPPELLPEHDFEPLLSSGEDVLVFRVTDESWGENQIIVVPNGSLVLNYPLVNHENRKLAAKLIEACGATGMTEKVVFIESEAGGPPVLDKEPSGGFPTPLELLKVWPLNALLLHLTVLGIVVCLARAPIFGRPRELPAESPADFGKHVAALGKLLAQAGDRNYAQARIAQYRQLAERRSGRSHLKTNDK
jgi:hypothetical protein